MCSTQAAPQPGPAAELREGDLRGGPAGRRRGAEGQPVLPASLPMKGLLCVGSGSGRGGETRVMAPHLHLGPTWHQPASLGRRAEAGGSGGTPGPDTPHPRLSVPSCLWADATPQCWNILPSASPPGFQLLPGGSCGLRPPYPGREGGWRALGPEPWLMWGLMSSWWYLERADPSLSNPGSSLPTG